MKDNVQALIDTWSREMESAATYRAIAEREENSRRKGILERLAKAEDRHADRLATRIRELGADVPNEGAFNLKLGLTLRLADPEKLYRTLEANEQRDNEEYQRIAPLLDAETRLILEENAAEEEEHAEVLRKAAPRPEARTALDRILGKERHVRGASWISDAIYGVNDGLGAVFGIVSGMAGYTGGSKIVLMTGLAGTLASALSMGSSAYLAAKSQREVYESEIAREKSEIESNPDEEQEELELFYELKGFSQEEAKSFAARMRERPDNFLKTLVQEELGLSEESFPNQWKACVSAALSTAVGGMIPVIPFFFSVGITAVIWSAVLAIIAHFAVGVGKSLVTTRPWWISGLEMAFVAVISGALTYALGLAFAVH